MGTVLRKSRQRDTISRLLRSSRTHLSAQDVLAAIRTDFPSASLGNVYRNLNILVETNEAVRLRVHDRADVFEARREPHFHFICARCETVIDVAVPPELDQRILDLIEASTGGTVSSSQCDYYGTCAACRDKDERGTRTNER